MKETGISIAIPTYEYNGEGVFFLSKLFSTLATQTFQDFEVVVADHSKDNKIQLYCEGGHSFPIKYVRNEKERGNGPVNTNVALNNSVGRVIKILFQDDFLATNNALEIIYNQLTNSSHKWLACGSNQLKKGSTKPHNNYITASGPTWPGRSILEGFNQIGSPSVLAIKQEVKTRFDPNMTYLMDCEYYFHLMTEHGPPLLIPQTLITNTEHPEQISNTVAQLHEVKQRETAYCLNKYNL
jgi:glycosyltransferase involved in cell wall biosynthesis